MTDEELIERVKGLDAKYKNDNEVMMDADKEDVMMDIDGTADLNVLLCEYERRIAELRSGGAGSVAAYKLAYRRFWDCYNAHVKIQKPNKDLL